MQYSGKWHSVSVHLIEQIPMMVTPPATTQPKLPRLCFMNGCNILGNEERDSTDSQTSFFDPKIVSSFNKLFGIKPSAASKRMDHADGDVGQVWPLIQFLFLFPSGKKY